MWYRSSPRRTGGLVVFLVLVVTCPLSFFFFNDTATTEIYTLSLHDALPIPPFLGCSRTWSCASWPRAPKTADRKSTRLNSSHVRISYAVFCLKKKKKHN